MDEAGEIREQLAVLRRALERLRLETGVDPANTIRLAWETDALTRRWKPPRREAE